MFKMFTYKSISKKLNICFKNIKTMLFAEVHIGKNPHTEYKNAIIFFPYRPTQLNCGISGIVAYEKKELSEKIHFDILKDCITEIQSNNFKSVKEKNVSITKNYLGGPEKIASLKKEVRFLKSNAPFVQIFNDLQLQADINNFSAELEELQMAEEKAFSNESGLLSTSETDAMAKRLEDIKDIRWSLQKELSENILKTKKLMPSSNDASPSSTVNIFKKINAVLNSIDRLEVRGRDSAGISLLFVLQKKEFEKFRQELAASSLKEQLRPRTNQDVLGNHSISINDITNEKSEQLVTFSVSYKVAAEIGSLGDNVSFIRNQIKNDPVFQLLTNFDYTHYSVTAHTRWASVGEISVPNCHPIDNESKGCQTEKTGIIHVSLNGDIDNYLELKKEYENSYDLFQENISTDTKIIPMQIETYLKKGNSLNTAFQMAVNDFEGSHAIIMHTDLAPGKIFLAQKGSGQAIFVGISGDHFMPTSEIYGFIEETNKFIKLDGETVFEGKNGPTQGQIFVLSNGKMNGSDTPSPLNNIEAMYYDGTPILLSEDDIKETEITSRDIDRQDFDHYFLKEISESPVSVEKTLYNRWKIKPGKEDQYITTLDESSVPESIISLLNQDKIKRIYFTGQGTAGVAALACANILNYYLSDPSIHVGALKASELSGFILKDNDTKDSMLDTIVIAISQSGTTTDTNRAVDMVKERGAKTLAIVNRRDSDLSFKVDGVIYTSSGRDIEMSVASTKAFYSQIVAGAILGLHITNLQGKRDETFISEEIKELISLPSRMRAVLSNRPQIEFSARTRAVTKTYWAAVGSGPNKASADEIRIKLSELCYKTISSDYVEDKKHIDLSSEPLIIICAAGTRESVLGDIIKDTAIFHAHKALPIVICDEGEERFNEYAEDIFPVPKTSEHLAPIMNTLVGHIWGYYAALSINEGSKFIYNHRREIQENIDEHAGKGLNIYEILFEKKFREKAAGFYREFMEKKNSHYFPSDMGFDSISNLLILLKYLTGRLPVTDFEFDFGKKGTALNIINTLFESMNNSINFLARPVDAIKHQAKTVTVGTSRLSEKIEGILFESLDAHGISVSQLTNKNVIVVKNLQNIVSEINGSILYKIGKLNLLGEPTETSTIEVIKKEGVLKSIPSRVETDTILKGTKRIIVRQGNVYIGKGRKDGRSIIVIPASSMVSDSDVIENLLLLNISFKQEVPLFVKVKALGGKHEHIKNFVQENSIKWDDKYLDEIEMSELFGSSAEKISDKIVANANGE